MSLHNYIQNYINDLQELLKESDEQVLMDKARTLWEEGQDNARYGALEQYLESDKFPKPAKPLSPESNQGHENKSVKKRK